MDSRWQKSLSEPEERPNPNPVWRIGNKTLKRNEQIFKILQLNVNWTKKRCVIGFPEEDEGRWQKNRWRNNVNSTNTMKIKKICKLLQIQEAQQTLRRINTKEPFKNNSQSSKYQKWKENYEIKIYKGINVSNWFLINSGGQKAAEWYIQSVEIKMKWSKLVNKDILKYTKMVNLWLAKPPWQKH